ncbi:hypothetical protein ACC728_37320, partial [Rhizobium ruizarguesonis]
LFTHICEGKTAALLASATGASERGVRIMCDYLVVHGFLRKESGQYRKTPSTRMFLDRNSPAYMGSAVEFGRHDASMGVLDDCFHGIPQRSST